MSVGFIPRAGCTHSGGDCFRLSQCLGGCPTEKEPTPSELLAEIRQLRGRIEVLERQHRQAMPLR